MPIQSNDLTNFFQEGIDAVNRGSADFASFLDDFPDLGGLLPEGPLLDILTGGADAVLGIMESLIAELGGTLTPDALLEEFVPDAQRALMQIPIPGVTPPTTPAQQFADAFETNNRELAVQTLVPFTGIDPTDQEQVDAITDGLTSAFDLITVTRAGEVLLDKSSLTLPPAYDIKSQFGTDAPSYTSFVSSVEELQLEFRSVIRDVTEVIVHSTETHANVNLDADQIEEMATTFGASSMPYHYVIKRDGSLQRGLDVDTVAEHCPEQNHNAYSISLILVGGLNIATGASVDDEFTQAAAYTREQFNTFWYFMKSFFDRWPGGQALGHGDVLGYTVEPGFDVREFCRAEFGKVSLFVDPVTEAAFDSRSINDSRIRQSRIGLGTNYVFWNRDKLL